MHYDMITAFPTQRIYMEEGEEGTINNLMDLSNYILNTNTNTF